ncbi:MAG: lysophospholipase [Chloroflexales bacterium]|nr:lysophospholipase [Chloroflexales bacterium]
MMLRRSFKAIIFWLTLFEVLAAGVGWWGLTWGSRRFWIAPVLALPSFARRLRHTSVADRTTLFLALPFAILLQLAGSHVRNWTFNPLLRLRPGMYGDREIARIDVPTTTGPVPALHIIPRRPTRTAVCVAHGSGCDKTFYAWELVEQLLRIDTAVLLIDLDGHGESARYLSFPAILQNITGSVDWLRQRYDRIGIIGISLGGAVATRAVADGTHVDALVILAAPPRLRLTRRQINTKIIPLESIRLLRPAVLRLLRDGSLYHIIRAWKTSGIRSTISTWDLFDALDLIGSFNKIATTKRGKLPILLIYAGSDAIVLPTEAERVRQAQPPSATFHLLPRASHISLPIEPRTLKLATSWLYEQLHAIIHEASDIE